jgi:hypothetical protein
MKALSRLSVGRKVFRAVQAASLVAEAVRLSKKSQDVMVRIPVLLDHAYVMAAEKNLGGAEKAAQQALTGARNLGLFRLQLEASLTLGHIELQTRNAAAAHARLQHWRKGHRREGLI